MNQPLLPFLAAAIPALAATLVKKGTVDGKQLIAAFLFGALVFGFWEINVKLASTFAWVAAITSLLINGNVVFQAVTKGL